jgi:DNA ligase-associated metallophosphoesterase
VALDGAYSIEIAGLCGWIFPQRALYIEEYQALLIADAHLGKAASFRRLGVPVPRGTTQVNLSIIDGLIETTQARRLIFLGDLFHNEVALRSRVAQQWQQWRARHAALAVTLVEGNHDAKALRAGPLPAAFGIEVVDEPHALGPLALCHLPQRVDGAYALAGHIHPSVRLQGKAADALRLPCFWFGAQAAVLPAFGEFTGSHVVRPEPGDRVFVVADDRVLPVPL